MRADLASEQAKHASTPLLTALRPTVQRHAGIARRWQVRLLIALCALPLLLGTSCASFKAAPVSPSVAVRPTATAPAPSAETQVGGLEATMQVVIAGPYFLRELLPVDVALTNDTQQAAQLLEPGITADLCHDSALMARLTAGSEPSVVFPPSPIGVGCTNELRTTQLQPAETLTIHQYVPLTRSGAVTLSMQSARLCTPASPLCSSATPYPYLPLDGHWPTVQLQVQPQVPPDRALTLQEQPGRVLIDAPAGAQAQLLAMQSMSCDRYLAVNGARWTPLATTILEEATCPTAHPTWVYIVSAPGYAIVSGSQHG
jgi:hypothetical protein